MGVVVFNPNTFREVYPQFVDTPNVRLDWWFAQAETLLNNTDCSIVKDLGERERLLMLLMRHLAALDERAEQGGLVGRIGSATEGSVSVSADLSGVSGKAAWFAQTPWGLTYWQMTAKYRAFRYVPGGCYARR